MKKNKTNTIAHLALGVVAMTATMTPAHAVIADDDTSSPISLHLSLMSDTVSLGEPIILKYSIDNNTQHIASIYMGQDKKAWIRFALTDTFGNVALSAAELDEPTSGLHRSGAHISPNSHSGGYVVETQKLRPSKPGNYVLSAHVRLIYRDGDVNTSLGTFQQDFNFPLTVIAADPQRLSSSVASLQSIILESKVAEEKRVAVEALLSMSPSTTKLAWRSLLTDPRLDYYTAFQIVEQLGSVHSIESADLLAEMKWDKPRRWVEGSLPIDQYLQQLLASKDLQIKQHVTMLFANHGEKPSDRIIGPID